MRTKADEKARAFFIQYAKARRFDPLVAVNWYKLSRKKDINSVRTSLYKQKYAIIN